MLSQFIGEIDTNGAAVLCSMVVIIGVIVTSMIVKRRSRLDLEHEFQLKSMKQQNKRDKAFYALETERGYKFKQLEGGLITSHSSDRK